MKPLRWIVVLGRTLGFVPFFVWELILANLEVAREVMTPKHGMEPGIIRVPLEARTDLEIMLFANLISLTPGTLTLGVTDDRSALYVHGFHVKTVEGFRTRLASLERRLLKVMR